MPVGPSALDRGKAVLGVALGVVLTVAKGAFTPHRAALGNLASMPLTVAGVGCIDFAAWHISHGIGWLCLGLSLIVLEHLIADET